MYSLSERVASAASPNLLPARSIDAMTSDPTNTPQDQPTPLTKRAPIRIGSQRSAADMKNASEKPATAPPVEQPPAETVAPPTVETAVEAPAAAPVETKVVESPAVELPPAPPAIPELTEDLEAEVEAALGGMSLDQMIADEDVAVAGDDIEPDTRRRATVVKVHRDNVFFSLGTGREGVASLKTFKEPPEPGTALDVIVTGHNVDEGLYELMIPGASANVGDWSDVSEGIVVEARVTGSNTGGLECMINNLRGFIPASQISLYRVENMAEYVDKKLQCVVTEANSEKRNLVLSHRAVLEREKEAGRAELLKNLEVGQMHEGIVRSLRDFGAFVDLGGIDGLVHISKMSWDRVNHPSDVLKEGQKIKVKIERIDPQTGKIGLSYRDTLADPWSTVESNFSPNATVTGTVTRIANFGAFVKLAPGIEGLVHISELAHHRVGQVSSVVKEGQEVEVKILSIDRDAQRMSLSIKATQSVPGPASTTEADDDEPLRELAVPKTNKPLKGGVDKPSGGEGVGLNW